MIEKLIVAQLSKKFSAFYGNRRFVTIFITACQYYDILYDKSKVIERSHPACLSVFIM
jgi:arginine/lysine/ornithine decarboxylase